MSQTYEEFKPKKEIEIKFYRLLPPKLISSYPLNGLYHNINSIESSEHMLDNKFSKFDFIESQFCGENLFSLSPNFGRALHKEKLEGFLTYKNISNHEITIKSLDVYLIIDERPETKTKQQNFIFNIIFPKEGVILDKGEVYHVKIMHNLDCVSKYTIFSDLKVWSTIYDYQYNEAKQKNLVKDTKEIIINGENILICLTKRLTFDVIYPFKVLEKFHNYQMNTCIIELKIANISQYPLTLTDINLYPKSNKDLKLFLVDSLQEISKNQSQELFPGSNSQSSFLSSKYLTLLQDEEVSVLFKITDTSLFLNEEKFVLHINWLNLFDIKEKTYIYKFSNTLNTFNSYYKISVIEKPERNVYINENFKIIMKVETKNLNKKYIISLSPEALRDNDKSNDRELEIIDIKEKKIELSKKSPENKFIIICKSDVLGHVYLPRLKFLLYEDNNTHPTGNVFDALLSFNCLQKREDK